MAAAWGRLTSKLGRARCRLEPFLPTYREIELTPLLELVVEVVESTDDGELA